MNQNQSYVWQWRMCEKCKMWTNPLDDICIHCRHTSELKVGDFISISMYSGNFQARVTEITGKHLIKWKFIDDPSH